MTHVTLVRFLAPISSILMSLPPSSRRESSNSEDKCYATVQNVVAAMPACASDSREATALRGLVFICEQRVLG